MNKNEADVDRLDGCEEAKSNWQRQMSIRMFLGDVYDECPSLSEDGFPIRISFDEKYVREYNEFLDRLLDEHGIPEWNPGRVIGDESNRTQCMDNGQDFESFCEQVQAEDLARVLRAVEQSWKKLEGARPLRASYCLNGRYIIVGGDINRGTRFDLVDAREGEWTCADLELDENWIAERRRGPAE
ncbi:hypothetical protein [Stratiformator vulcanicus]|uniref:Uncharacterized protein n=1 Tax=Stratiformator vulcanicus TaxID=2527980 RepID=A0A517QY27_9PLAN|nr:hypothetical protein [Stratiformator vulcanicus]QDT36559.1 hypothetical protein Pan189_09190 [Stratiformator vulcanicus]